MQSSDEDEDDDDDSISSASELTFKKQVILIVWTYF